MKMPLLWTGIAAALLKGGRTAHSRFQIPLKLEPDSLCSVKALSKARNEFREAHNIIIDEATLIPAIA